MTISGLARASKARPKTRHYWESLGLLPRAALILLALAAAAEARPLPRDPAAFTLRPTTAAALQPGATHPLPALEASRLQSEFNRAARKVRLVAILSPTCPYCRHGYEVVASLLRQYPSEELEALIVWLPILPGDNRAQALP